jgi:8-oxo-dGTP pyrophosphatase MutT (NUDIX family)
MAEPVRPVIPIAAALIDDDRGRILLVRKAGTVTFMQPGGKIEPGETALAALRRELDEELGLAIDPATTRYLGRFTAPAANEPGHLVEAELFSLRSTHAGTLAAEIEEAIWVDPAAVDGLELAPLTSVHVLPIARAGQVADANNRGSKQNA